MKKARIEKELEPFPLSEETQMSQMSPVLIKKRTKLSTAQATFNRLNKKIVALRHDIQELPEREKVITDFYKKHVHALFVKEGELKYALLIRLDTVYQTGKLTEKNKSLLAELVLAESEQIDDFPLSDAQIEEMHRIREKYELIVSELTPEEMEKERVAVALEAFSFLGGQPNTKMRQAANMEELEKLLEEYYEEAFQQEAERKSSCSKTQERAQPKMTKRELKQKLQEEQTMRSIREIYSELVKELHPDKETDENIRQLKEERMKQLTEAYQNKDLASLLSMQLNWLEDTALDPASQTDEVLKRYNKVLRKQLSRLEQEYELLCSAPFPGVLGAYAGYRQIPMTRLKSRLETMLQIHRQELENVEDYVCSYETLTGLRKNLKNFQARQKEKMQQMDWDDLIDLFLMR